MASALGTGRGYSRGDYARSLSEFGVPRLLPLSGGWVLERPIPGTSAHDLVGPYPLFTCSSWSDLAADLEGLGESLVSVVLVADPLGGAAEQELTRAFPDRLVVFKRHLVRDLDEPARLPTHHRRHIRLASDAVDVEVCTDPAEHLDDWVRLYSGLVARHGLVGIRAFSAESFRRQLALPGLVAVRAERNGVTVGMTLWFEDAPNAYYHLGAYSEEGYEVSASYALFVAALEHLGELGVRWVDLGGTPEGATEDGLVRFKRGWASGERAAHLCGRILNHSAYAQLAERGPAAASGWFPTYRATDRDFGGAQGGSHGRGSTE